MIHMASVIRADEDCCTPVSLPRPERRTRGNVEPYCARERRTVLRFALIMQHYVVFCVVTAVCHAVLLHYIVLHSTPSISTFLVANNVKQWYHLSYMYGYMYHMMYDICIR
jgi:hypothetical protein